MALTAATGNGRLNIDNNRAERAVKPFVIGRKAWLFANTRTGATGSAVLYSMVESAKINGFDPYKDLSELFEKLPFANTLAALAKQLPFRSVRQIKPGDERNQA